MAKAAVVQMCSSTHVEDNLKSLALFFLEAQALGAELLVLPENFSLMGAREEDKWAIAEASGDGPIQTKISQLAKQHKLWVIAGSIPLKGTGKRVKSSCLVYDNAGLCVARYDKIHLFDVSLSDDERYQESGTIEAGSTLTVVDTPVGRVGLSVCYDIRFPELYRQLTTQGAEILAIPSAFTAVTGAAHWDVLCRARAIENLCYVLASNQGGIHENGRQTYGHSMVIEPWGNVVALQQQKTGVIVADIDLQHVKQLRQQFPCNEHHVLNTEIK
jgi:predicted amidohydrolase